MDLSTKTRKALRIPSYMSVCESRKDFCGVRKKELAEVQKMTARQANEMIDSLKKQGLIMNVGFERETYILSRPFEYISMSDICKIK